MAESALDDSWVESLVKASAGLDQPGELSAVVAVTIGKKQKAVLNIVDGRVTGPGEEEAVAVTVPTTADQLAAFSDGSESMARSYMMGDVKPVGSTGALLAIVELFENPQFRSGLSGG
jgi:hypothetical protein